MLWVGKREEAVYSSMFIGTPKLISLTNATGKQKPHGCKLNCCCLSQFRAIAMLMTLCNMET